MPDSSLLDDADIQQGEELTGEEEFTVLSLAAKMSPEAIETFTQSKRQDVEKARPSWRSFGTLFSSRSQRGVSVSVSIRR
jgi:hypothetical protein